MASLTAKGAATRARIVESAAELILRRGVAGTSLDDVRAATGTSKSQLFHYFPDGKADLVHAVATWRADMVLDEQRPVFDALDSWRALVAWRDAVIEGYRARQCDGGCPMGSLSSELAKTDSPARDVIAGFFGDWQQQFRAVLVAMKERGVLRADADIDDLALATLASLQGGTLLAQTGRSTRPLEVALDAALAHLRTFEA